MAASATASPSGWLEWERVEPPEWGWALQVDALGYIRPLFGASDVGFAGFGIGAAYQPYFSADGRQWQVATVTDADFSDVTLGVVTGYQGGFVATGWTIPSRGDRYVSAAWASVDGVSWTNARVMDADLGWMWVDCSGTGGRTGRINAVAAVGTVLVGLGGYIEHQKTCDLDLSEVFEPRLWWSSKGTEWERGQVPGGYRGLGSVVLIGGDQFVLAENDHVWVSGDGNSWTSAVLPLPEGSRLERLVEHEGSVLAYASGGQDHWHVLASTDGTNWSEAGQLERDDRTHFWKIVAAGGILATLQRVEGGMGIVTSRDGVSWSQPQTDPFAGSWPDTIVTNGRSMLVAETDPDDGRAIAMWVATIK